MKKVFKMSVRIKGTEKVFAEGFAPGVIATQELHYDLEPAEYDRSLFIASLLDKQNEMLKEHVHVSIVEMEDK